MSDFMGDAHSVALQQSLQARIGEVDSIPVLANGGRILNVLDPDRYGWDRVQADVARDGYVALTMVDRDHTLRVLRDRFGPDCALPSWEAFTGRPEDVVPVCTDLCTALPLPDGWTVSCQTRPDDRSIHDAQVLNARTGVAPAPAYFLRGDHVPSMLASLRDHNGDLAACASGTMRYHPDGPLGGWLFAGGVSVDPAYRRRGLGGLVNAHLLAHSHRAYAWRSVLEQARADNAPSVGMITRCGLRRDPGRVTILVNPSGQTMTR